MILREYIEQNRSGVSNTPPGFMHQYKSFPHYILDITETIWEKRAIWLLFDTYAEDIIVHSGARTTRGRNTVILGTLKTLYAFPDRKMKGEAVIWGHYEDTTHTTKEELAQSTEKKFFSSHRILSNATNLGSTPYGDATGKHIYFRTIADCLAKDNVIYEEWLVRDNLYVIEQLGYNPLENAQKDTHYNGVDVHAFDDGCVDIKSVSNQTDDSTITHIHNLFNVIWDTREYKKLSDFYAKDAVSYGIRNTTYRNNTERVSLFENLFTPFDTNKTEIQQITATYYKDKTELAVRWRLKTKHTQASSLYGEPHGVTVNILGINHYVIVDDIITQEWMLYDAYDTLCQIYRR